MFKFIAALATGLALTISAYSQPSGEQRQVPLGFCYDTSLSSAVSLTSFTCASFTGTGNGTSLTVTNVTGQLQVGQTISGSGVPSGTTITAGPASGGAGTYTTSLATTSSGASLTSSGAPQLATYAAICAYTSAINYRDDGTAPTATPISGGQAIPAGQCIGYNGTLSSLQFIQQSSNGGIGISFYK